MSRSGYEYYDDDDRYLNIWRGAVKSAIRGKRGQAFLKELLSALDALHDKRLITDALERDGCVCALGAVGRARGLPMDTLDPEDPEGLAEFFGIAPALARELMWLNDEASLKGETGDTRYLRVKAWVEEWLNGDLDVIIKIVITEGLDLKLVKDHF